MSVSEVSVHYISICTRVCVHVWVVGKGNWIEGCCRADWFLIPPTETRVLKLKPHTHIVP